MMPAMDGLYIICVIMVIVRYDNMHLREVMHAE